MLHAVAIAPNGRTTLQLNKLMKREQIEILEHYFPTNSIPLLIPLIEEASFNLSFTKPRNSKLGDFRPPCRLTRLCTITINGNLNQYQMLVTFLHEYAHYKVFKKYLRHCKPHGEEWKHEFTLATQPFLNDDIFPQPLLNALRYFMTNPKAGATTDVELARTMALYDNQPNHQLIVDEVPMKTVFTLKNGHKFIKISKLRKRYKCRSLDNGNIYLVSPIAEVMSIE